MSWATGVMVYEMLTGRRPFEPDNDSISSVILKVIQQPPAPMDSRGRMAGCRTANW